MRRMSMMVAALLLVALALGSVPAVKAEPAVVTQASVTHTVDSTSDNGPGSLRNVVENAGAGDTITFDVTGTITLTTGEIEIDKDLTISGPGVSLLTISGNDQSRVFNIVAGASVTIDGLTIRNGDASDWGSAAASGGGVFNEGNLTLSNCVLQDNVAAGAGGGVAQDLGATLHLIDCHVLGNHARGLGGGVFSGIESTLTISESVVTQNTATGLSGGGIYNAATMTITDSTVSHNEAYWGGGIYTLGYVVSIADSRIIGNRATESGAGIFNRRTLSITDSVISGNQTYLPGPGSFVEMLQSGGGGILNFVGADLEITDSTINGNLSNAGGGALNAGNLTISDSVVSGNESSLEGGGGLYNMRQGELQIIDSRISDNIADSFYGGAGVYNQGSTTVTRSLVSENFSVASGGGILNDFDADMEITNSTISSNIAREGGGIMNWGEMSITSSTITGNSAWWWGGGIYSGPNTRLAGSIIAKNPSGGNCYPFMTSLGYNLSDDESCGLEEPTDLPNSQNVNLGPLAENGGPTKTHALLDGSAAIDAILKHDCLVAHDQRSVARPQGEGCDIGAFEVKVEVDEPLPTLTITASSPTMVYGDPVPAITPGYDGFVDDDSESSFTELPTCATGATSSSDAGTYETTCSGAAIDGYRIVYVPGELTIEPRPITVTADSLVKREGDDDPDLTYRVTDGDLVNEDELSGTLQREEGDAPGNYSILRGTLGASTNYALTFYAGTLTILAGEAPVDYEVCLDFDNDKVKKLGSTVPIRLMLCDEAGNNLSSADITLNATRLVKISNDSSGAVEAMSSGNANPDGDFRFADDRYVFNLSTKGLSEGTWQLEFTVDGQMDEHYRIEFKLRR
jgi:hypothetical protein